MLWGTKQIGDYQQHVISQPDSDANKDRCTMGPNEVQEPGQANMSPQATCDLMRKYQVPLKDNHGYYLMGPSTSSNPNGLNDWYPKVSTARVSLTCAPAHHASLHSSGRRVPTCLTSLTRSGERPPAASLDLALTSDFEAYTGMT
jgi:hypothetical protein